MLLWLPLSGGSALAASLDMQLQPGDCHDPAMVMSQGDMDGHDMMHHDHGAMPAPVTDDPGHTSCGVCHLACTAYLDAPAVAVSPAVIASQAVAFIPEIFVSHLSAPLLPPPLVAA